MPSVGLQQSLAQVSTDTVESWFGVFFKSLLKPVQGARKDTFLKEHQRSLKPSLKDISTARPSFLSWGRCKVACAGQRLVCYAWASGVVVEELRVVAFRVWAQGSSV